MLSVDYPCRLVRGPDGEPSGDSAVFWVPLLVDPFELQPIFVYVDDDIGRKNPIVTDVRSDFVQSPFVKHSLIGAHI